MPSKKKKGRAKKSTAAVQSANQNENAAPDISKAWEDVLNDPNSSKSMRDITQSHLNDAIGMGTMFSGKAEMRMGDKQYEWTIVEDFEEGNWGDLGDTSMVSISADIILQKEGDDSMEILLSARGMRMDGTLDAVAGYPRLCGMCNCIIGDRNVDNEIKLYWAF